MCARAKWMLKWDKKLIWVVFISKWKLQRWKIPAQAPAESSAVGYASCRRTWGIGSCKNLMKTHLECQSTRSMSWAVKKASSQVEVGCDGLRATTVISKSSFLPKESERRISRGYCRDIGPRSSLSMYILGLRPKLRTRGLPRMSKHCQGSPC